MHVTYKKKIVSVQERETETKLLTMASTVHIISSKSSPFFGLERSSYGNL